VIFPPNTFPVLLTITAPVITDNPSFSFHNHFANRKPKAKRVNNNLSDLLQTNKEDAIKTHDQ
jgi:hypothetical protein